MTFVSPSQSSEVEDPKKLPIAAGTKDENVRKL